GGKKKPLFAEPAVENRLVRVYAAVAKKRPVAARLFGFLRVAFDDEDFFFLATRLRDDLAKRISDEGVAPELKARIILGGIAFVTDAVHDSDVRSVGNCVSALNRAPCFQLRCAVLGFFLRMPADARRIEDNLRAAKRGEARTLRIPLVPADLNADARVFRIEIRKTEIARREI